MTAHPGGGLAAVIGDPGEWARRTVERLRRYVEAESPSRNEAAIRAFADLVATDLEAAGSASVRKLDVPGFGQHVVADFAAAESVRELLVLGHLDTVHPVGTLAEQPFRERDGRIEGPGSYDMKGGIAILISALEVMQQRGLRPKRPLRILLTCDEEIGSHSGRVWIEKFAPTTATVLVIEPSLENGGVKTARKGVDTFRLTAIGRAAHAGMDPGSGISAISELAFQVVEVLALADPARGTTINVGTVGGGTATNVVAAQATAQIDVRYRTQAESDRVLGAFRQLKPKVQGASLHLERTESRPPLERTDAVVGLYERARGIALELGVDLPEGGTGGGSDGCLTAALGVPTLDGLGPRGWGAHATDEHILAEDIPFRIAFFTRLLTEL